MGPRSICFSAVGGAFFVGVACANAQRDEDGQAGLTCDEAVNAAHVAMDAIDAGSCVDDGDCVFDSGNVCGIDIAEFAYAADDSARIDAAFADAWADACALGTCGRHEDTFLLAARCADGTCRLADRREVCAARIDDVRDQVDVVLDRSCDVASDCGGVFVEARCGEHRFQLTRLARAREDTVRLLVTCEVLAQGMTLICADDELEGVEGSIACIDDVCVFLDPNR